jgi:hypothetical protein
VNAESCCILNAGPGAWAFDGLARLLRAALWVDVSETPRDYNYLLRVEDRAPAECGELFIPYWAMELAADKRLLAAAFADSGVPTPETTLMSTLDEARRFQATRPEKEWCLKYPTGSGASGHRLLADVVSLPAGWPRPLVVQEFVRLERPEVYRLYGAGGEVFGWVARRFPEGARPSPWVAHARGARYAPAGDPPAQAVEAARAALSASGLLESFGCADLLCKPDGQWVVLEVGTDGMFNHVDRDLGLPALESEIQRRIAEAFWARRGSRPWGDGGWRPREADRTGGGTSG